MKTISDFDMPDFLSEFLNYLHTIKGKSPNTVLVYFYDLRLFLRFLLQHKKIVDKSFEFEKIDINNFDLEMLKTVKLADLYAFMSHVSNIRENSSHGRARKVASLKSLFKYLFDKAKYIPYNPAAELESPKIIKRLPRYLDVDESKNLLDSISGDNFKRDYAIITLFLNCGMRLSELVGINISSIKEKTTMTVIGKGDKERFIPLNEACVAAIDDYLVVREKQGVKDPDALFLSERRQRISKEMVQKIVKKFIREAGLDAKKYSTHKLRHTAATLMYKYGNVNIRELQELLGHESIATTEIYTHLDKQQLRQAVEKNPLAKHLNKNLLK
jgi:integrase/recombinase XerD